MPDNPVSSPTETVEAPPAGFSGRQSHSPPANWRVGFWTLIATQFQGAFNDNALKFLVIYRIAGDKRACAIEICSIWNIRRCAKGVSMWKADQCHREVWFVAVPQVMVGRDLEGKRWRKKLVSLNLVYSDWANLGGYREIGDARAHNDLLDNRARHLRIDPWGCRYPHVFAPDKQTISSRRPDFFHTGRDPDSLHLL
jgi:hypothetical protein